VRVFGAFHSEIETRLATSPIGPVGVFREGAENNARGRACSPELPGVLNLRAPFQKCNWSDTDFTDFTDAHGCARIQLVKTREIRA
jgi:hypothetical protein